MQAGKATFFDVASQLPDLHRQRERPAEPHRIGHEITLIDEIPGCLNET
jgi:hypothetical protein